MTTSTLMILETAIGEKVRDAAPMGPKRVLVSYRVPDFAQCDHDGVVRHYGDLTDATTILRIQTMALAAHALGELLTIEPIDRKGK